MNKKAVSLVIVMVLMILLVVVAIGIIWFVVYKYNSNNLTQNPTAFIAVHMESAG